MPNLREIIDGGAIAAAAPSALKPSPTMQSIQPQPKLPAPTPGKTQTTTKAPKGQPSGMAKHISDHLQDTVGATKEGFEGLTNAKLQYDQQRESMQRNLAPVQSVIDHVSQMHNLDPRFGQGTPGMMPGQQSPDNTGVPGLPGGQGNGEDENQAFDENGNPINMSQTVGKMNQSRPSQAGFQPGVAPGDGQTVRPPKMGQAQPGKPTAGNSPQPRGSGNQQFGPSAAPPKGAGKLPGAKGPGDPKVANKVKKAQNNSSGSGKSIGKGGGVNVTVHAAEVNVIEGARNRLAAHGGMEVLRTLSCGPEALRDKVSDPGKEIAYNPKMSAGKMKMCKACGEMHAEGKCMKGKSPTKGSSKPAFDAAGTSKGAKHRNSTRGQRNLSKKEKAAHWQTMDAGKRRRGL